MSNRDRSREIHDMIQTFNLGGSPELMASQILDILTAMNERMDQTESDAIRAARTTSRLAKLAGIQPD